MRNYFAQLPLARICFSRGKMTWGTMLLVCVLGFFYLLQFGKLVSPKIQRTFLHQFHLRQESFVKWSLLQTVPSMYSFANELWWSRIQSKGEPEFIISNVSNDQYYVWLNHFPVHFVTYNFYRDLFVHKKESSFVYMKSRYRGQTVITKYRLDPQENGLKIIHVEKVDE